MKKIISTLIILALCLSNFICVQASEQQYVFSISDAVIEYTQEGNVSVSVSKNAGFASFILEVKYNTDFLELISSKKSTGADTVYNNSSIVINDDTPGKIKMVFASQENVTQDISLVDLTFKAIDVPENNGDTLIELNASFLDDADWSNSDLTSNALAQNGTVNIQALKDVEITNSGKTEYIENQALDLSTISATAIYNNSEEKELSDEEYEITNYSTPLKVGEVPKLKYTENGITIEKELGITVREKRVSGIRVDSTNVKTEYIEDQEFVSDRLVVYKVYDNDEEEQLADNKYTIDKNDVALTLADNKVVVSYTEGQTYSASINITVSEKKLVSIRLDGAPDKKVYKVGESFAIGNMKVYGTYNNGKEYLVTDYSINGFDGTFGEKSIYISKDGINSESIAIKIVVPGDVTYNGLVQPNDATALLQHIAGLIVLEDYRQVSADVYGNGNGIDPNDAVAILKYCAGYEIELK